MSWPLLAICVLGLFAAVMLASRYVRARIKDRHLKDAAVAALHTAFGESEQAPRLNCTWSHGLPVFKLVFTSTDARLKAEQGGALVAFTTAIQELSARSGLSKKGFTAKQGVYVTTESEQSELLAYAGRVKEQLKRSHHRRDA